MHRSDREATYVQILASKARSIIAPNYDPHTNHLSSDYICVHTHREYFPLRSQQPSYELAVVISDSLCTLDAQSVFKLYHLFVFYST